MASPAHRQYLALKAQHPDAILLFRMGDFYEMFGEDAKVGADVLQITLTSREFGRGDRVAMCGIPYHALQSYLKRFVDHGLKVAICEQLSEAGNGLVDRDVVRVVTPGTLIEPALLDERENNYLAAVNAGKDGYGLAYVDVTTGEFAVTDFSGPGALESLEAELNRLRPSERLVPAADVAAASPGHETICDDYMFDPETARSLLQRHFKVKSLEGFGCADMPLAIGAAGAVVAYVERANRSFLPLLTALRTYRVSSFMTLDRYTLRNLELMETARSGNERGSLLWVLDQTQTAMGGRLLRRILSRPLLDVAALERRLNVVEELFNLHLVRSQLKTPLGKVADLERLTGRICQGSALPQDLMTLGDSLDCIEDIHAGLAGAQSGELKGLCERLDSCPDVREEISRALAQPQEKRKSQREEGLLRPAMILPGYSPELDEVKASIRDSREWIAALESSEQESTGIKSLKVGYNKVFGYYIEISNSNSALVPADYIRKQTLVNAERFITPELKEHEAHLLQAEERISFLENRIFNELLGRIAQQRERLFRTADCVAHIDVYRVLADIASRRNYVRPRLSDGDALEIQGGRHPVVEVTLEDGFIPNDCRLDCEDRQVLIITGPNMGGKSTYLRQVALIVLMAQIGSFVPAEKAAVGLVDRIFTRVGAQDDIGAGQSTFMVEMVETANILNHATSRSLLVMDEVGRGTSTYDGLAIARAVAEYIHDHIGARTLFATHYHELTALAEHLKRVHNASVAVSESGSDVVFLHQLVAGGADRSYGIHVGRLAGLPSDVTERAEDVLFDLESQPANGNKQRRRRPRQTPLFGESTDRTSELLRELLEIDLSNLTPVQALMRLHELQEKGKRT